MDNEKSLPFTQLKPDQIPENVKREGEQWRAHEATAKVVSGDHIIVSIGERPTGGYDVRVNRIIKQGSRIIVNATEIPPKEGMMVTQAFSYPQAVVKLQENIGSAEVEVRLSKS
ncbi:protease complex subunit PrcB family protein [Laceyella sacchari]|jgi:hypothetical protein|uniref:Protease complex subunit PrcB family protein n=1 Tax=Laceyella sacchari TaxID=37482 RepID=A0ABY5U039_LACSH|nr:protease complex subunit PrcB family protein [Laceyella sacchari]TCW37862.1 protease stability complex PrcB-like protein [Laceyella sacchari]UWE02994.1 protease complex subunit PrcB family protein [Laceyella sacchari]